MATRMQQRRGTAAQWTSADPILAAGELGFETDTGKFKIGNGTSEWSALVYYASAEDLSAVIDGAPELLNTLDELAAALSDDPNFLTAVYESLENHRLDTTDVHGIADTGALATQTWTQDQATTIATNISGTAVSNHNDATANVHGITNTADLATQTYVNTAVTTHDELSLNVHGIADTTVLATESYADTAVSTHGNLTENVHGIVNTANLATQSYADNAVTTHGTDTTDVHGIADTGDLVLTDDARLSDTRTPTDDTVSTAKIVNSAVTSDKLAGDSVTEAKIADGAVTSGKIADGTIVDSDINAAAAIDWTKLAISSTVSSTELGYVAGVTSAVQTQLDAKYSSASASTDLALKADLASPALTGTPTAPTADAGTNTTQIATTEFVTGAVSDLVASAPGALDTLNELAAALGDDANFSTTVTNSLAEKAPIASPTFTGTVTVAASGIAFTDGTQTKQGVPSQTTINSISANYDLSTGGLDLRDTMVESTATSGITVTIPTNATTAYPVGTTIDFMQTGSGQITFAGASGVTLNGTPGLKTRAQWSSASLFKRSTDAWVVLGDLSA